MVRYILFSLVLIPWLEFQKKIKERCCMFLVHFKFCYKSLMGNLYYASTGENKLQIQVKTIILFRFFGKLKSLI